jgi:hypothetical protein
MGCTRKKRKNEGRKGLRSTYTLRYYPRDTDTVALF